MTEVLRTTTPVEDRYRELFAVTGDWVWEVDQDGVVLASSERVQDLFGYRQDEVMSELESALARCQHRLVESERIHLAPTVLLVEDDAFVLKTH